MIFGPKKLPEIARQVAKFMARFRMMSNDLKRQLESEMLNVELEEKETKPPLSVKQLEAPDGLRAQKLMPQVLFFELRDRSCN